MKVLHNMEYLKHYILLILFASIHSFSITANSSSLVKAIEEYCLQCSEKSSMSTATLILDKGQTALLSRAWLTEHALHSIDIQYFIWSNDNIGILAAEALLDAANRGVRVRVIVDDFLVEGDTTTLLSLAAHKNIHIKMYNPLHKTGVSKPRRLWNLGTNFRKANQRMHDKVAIFDQQIAITGGRNMADEYFDFNQEYAFRDRDILVYGKAVSTMRSNFENFWNDSLSQSVEHLLIKEFGSLTQEEIDNSYQYLSDYAEDLNNFSPSVKHSIQQLSKDFKKVVAELRWSDAKFIHDLPGKNDGKSGLKGGGQSTQAIAELIKAAKDEIIIQSPYLVLPKEGIQIFKSLIDQGVNIKISTNSLASTDNLAAYSGYHKTREKLMELGVQLYEYKPYPRNQALINQRYLEIEKLPIFAIHAKSMVIDNQTALIGTFNLDPRSIHLNTEVAMVVEDTQTANELRQLILDDMSSDNSWHITPTLLANQNPDKNVSTLKRLKLNMIKLLPLEPIL